jgi:hypothetical protein
MHDGEQSMLGITPQQVLEAWQTIELKEREADRYDAVSVVNTVDNVYRAAHYLNQPLPESARQRV